MNIVGGVLSSRSLIALDGVEVVVPIKEMNDEIQKFMDQQIGKSPEEIVKELQGTEFWNKYHSK
ncbi:hypothetical protein OHJ21_19225 [Virgibacillus sp. LDC1]|nr:hypothetical protein [Virgibacillus sp. LDC1]